MCVMLFGAWLTHFDETFRQEVKLINEETYHKTSTSDLYLTSKNELPMSYLMNEPPLFRMSTTFFNGLYCSMLC